MAIDKVVASFDEAVADVPDGATLMIDGFAGPGGTPQNLIRALRDHGAKDLTIIKQHGGSGERDRVRDDTGRPSDRHWRAGRQRAGEEGDRLLSGLSISVQADLVRAGVPGGEGGAGGGAAGDAGGADQGGRLWDRRLLHADRSGHDHGGGARRHGCSEDVEHLLEYALRARFRAAAGR